MRIKVTMEEVEVQIPTSKNKIILAVDQDISILQTVSKSSKTFRLLDCSNRLFKKWIKLQFTEDMTAEIYPLTWFNLIILFRAQILTF